MAVIIDNFDAEIEIKPRSARAQATPMPTAQPGLATPSSVPLKDAVLAVINAELDRYMRSRG